MKALNLYDREGTTAFDRMINLELDNLNRRIEAFGDNEFDVLAVTRRSITNVISILVMSSVGKRAKRSKCI